MKRDVRNPAHGHQLSYETLELIGTEVVRLTDAQGIGIAVPAGTAWITQHGDHDGIVVGAGKAFAVDRPGPVLVSPSYAATVVISALPARARTCRIQRVHVDGQHYPVLCARPQRVLPVVTGPSPAY